MKSEAPRLEIRDAAIRIAAVKTLPDAHGARPSDVAADEDVGALAPIGDADEAPGDHPRRPSAIARGKRLVRRWWPVLRWPLAVYGLSRALLLAVAIVETFFRSWPVWEELSNWDGIWYLRVLTEGYASHASHLQNTLGFLPLYPLLTWLPAHIVTLTPGWRTYEISGLLVSLVTGASATILIWRLAVRWWGEPAGRRVVLFLCFFPGTVVFSMVYTEGLILTLVAGCLLALDDRRWVLAGVLAGLSTAVGPTAVAIIPVCVVAAGGELRRDGWRDPRARRALVAPLLAPLGLLSFGTYLWIHTGDPLASYREQHIAWQESSSPLALLHTAERLYYELFPPLHPAANTSTIINTNYIAGLIGAVILLVGLFLIARAPRPSLAAIVWTLGVMVLTFTSAQTPPNARLLLCAFPAIIVFAQRLRGRWFTALMVLNVTLFFTLSWITFVGVDFRP